MHQHPKTEGVPFRFLFSLYSCIYYREVLLKGYVMSWETRIIIEPAILAGKPIVKGTRLSVEFIMGLLAQGWSEAEILRNYPGLTHEDIQACLAYAHDLF